MSTETGTVDTKQLPSHLDSKEIEQKWDRNWEDWGIHQFDPSRSREDTFIVDTPPPTVSGSLHVGHVFSYNHTDVVVRYKRMMGMNIFYPMGWDDNGLPTERRVQNYYNVRCDHHATGEYLDAATASATYKKDDPPRLVSRPNFIDLCLELTKEDEKVFKELWRRIGLSVDWQQEYSTIDKHSIKIAQQSFIDLFNKKHVYSLEAPTMWDVDFQTAVAQAELEDRNIKGNFHKIRFGVEGQDKSFVIATTRPELLAACVGVTFHPDDERYKDLEGKQAVTPVFHVKVPIFSSQLVDKEKGSGILMVCTFGDATDVAWWKEKGLAIRQILAANGRLIDVEFGKQGWESKNSDKANECYREIAGKTIKQAQKIMVELLRRPENDACGAGAPLVEEPEALEHAVKFYEKGDKPLEFITTRQWFVRLLDKKEELVQKGNEISWFPEHMRLRYKNWTENLQFDWCISRQRYFGVPFPVWYKLDSKGQTNYDEPIIAKMEDLPVDPVQDAPPGFGESMRGKANGFVAENDVFDTWFTSSLTPQLCSNWLVNQERHEKLFPMDLRPQSHEIIRTWAFYTIAKAMLHENKIPWKQVAISGWVLDPDRKKMSKSKGNVLTPMHLLDQYGADGVRYWSASARLGTDTAFDESIMKNGKRLVTKIFNASKFVLGLKGKSQQICYELDREFMSRLSKLVARANSSFEKLDYASALSDIERFFWADFTDEYLELVKQRAYNEENPEGQGSAIASLHQALSVLIRLFAPFLPYVCEEVWSWSFAEQSQAKSVHIASYPQLSEFEEIKAPTHAGLLDLLSFCRRKVNQKKTEEQKSVGAAVEFVEIGASKENIEKLQLVLEDLKSACKISDLKLVELEFSKEQFSIEEEQIQLRLNSIKLKQE